MPLTINTNMAASRASYFLSKNNDALQRSLDRLSSGKKITQPADDAGGLAVSMKMQGSIDNLRGAANNVANAFRFLQVQDGILDSAGQIVGRMAELQSLSTDVLKSSLRQVNLRSRIQMRDKLVRYDKSSLTVSLYLGMQRMTQLWHSGILGTSVNISGDTVSVDVLNPSGIN